MVWKPPALASELPRDPSADSLTARLESQGFGHLRLVHRLDAPACGVMVVARTKAAAAYYSAEIAARRWRKVYVAEVACDPGRAAALIGSHRAHLAADRWQARVVRSGGKPSFLTVLHVSGVPSAADRSHVLVQLLTGRFHQIRVMLASLGAPLVGDPLYGGPAIDGFYLEQVLLGGQPFGAAHTTMWRAPAGVDRPAWSSDLSDAIASELSRFSAG